MSRAFKALNVAAVGSSTDDADYTEPETRNQKPENQKTETTLLIFPFAPSLVSITY